MRQFLVMTGVAFAAAGCNFESSGGSAGATDSAATAGESSPGATEGGGSAATAGEGTGSATSESMDVGVSYCHGFQAVAEAPFLSMYVLGGEMLANGVLWPLECGPDGQWMFGLYPSLGGWDPMGKDVSFAVEVDVEGFNTDEAGHFFSEEVAYHIGCEEPFAGHLGVTPVYPPDSVTDLVQLDGKAADVRVTVLAGGKQLVSAATVTLSAPSDVVLQGCAPP